MFCVLLPAHPAEARAKDFLSKTMDPQWWFGTGSAAAQAMQKEDFSVAQQRLQALTESEPGDLRYWYNLGVAAYKDKNFREAIRAFESAAAEPALSDKALFGLANSYWQDGRKGPAIETLEGLIVALKASGQNASLLKKAEENLAYMKSAQPPAQKDEKQNEPDQKDENQEQKNEQKKNQEQEKQSKDAEKDQQQGQDQQKKESNPENSDNNDPGQKDSEEGKPEKGKTEEEKTEKKGSGEETSEEEASEDEDSQQGAPDSDELEKENSEEEVGKSGQLPDTDTLDMQKFEENQVKKRLRALPDHVGKRRYHIKPESQERSDGETGGQNAPRW